MKQSNFESSKLALEPYLQEPLVFNGLYANLGDWEDVIYRHSKEEEIGFSWKLSGEKFSDNSGNFNLEIDVKFKSVDSCNSHEGSDRLIVSQFVFRNIESGFSFELNCCSSKKYQLKLEKVYLEELLFGWIYKPNLYYYFVFNEEENLVKKINETEILEKTIINEVVFENLEIQFEGFFPAFLKVDNWVQESQKIIKQVKRELEINQIFSKELLEFIDETSKRLDSYIKNPGKANSLGFQNLPKLKEKMNFFARDKEAFFSEYLDYEFTVEYLKKLWSSFRYIGPLREAPKRFYLFDDPRGIDIGINGENTALVLALEQENKIPQYHRCIYQGKQIKEFELRDSDGMLEAVNWWLLECMKLPEIKSVVGWRGTINQVQLNSSGVEVSLPDVGFGVSQILPILVECLRVKEGETIILEQPEIHLHPSLQSKLADFFICMAKSGKNLVIETHSEHLINRLCLRVAQAESTEIQSLLNPLFVSFDEAEKTSVLKKIIINEYGEIENWPVGFFDEDDSRELMEATLKKRMTQFKA